MYSSVVQLFSCSLHTCSALEKNQNIQTEASASEKSGQRWPEGPEHDEMGRTQRPEGLFFPAPETLTNSSSKVYACVVTRRIAKWCFLSRDL